MLRDAGEELKLKALFTRKDWARCSGTMSRLLRLLPAAALPLCRAGGARARLSALTAGRLFTAGYRSSAAPVSASAGDLVTHVSSARVGSYI